MAPLTMAPLTMAPHTYGATYYGSPYHGATYYGSPFTMATTLVAQAEKLSEMLVSEKLGKIDSVIEFKIPDEVSLPTHLTLRFASLS